MNRREFFKALLGAGVACVLPKAIAPEQSTGYIAEYITKLQLDSKIDWDHVDPGQGADTTAIVMLNNDGTVAGLIHNIG